MDLMSSVRTSSATLDRRAASADRRWLVLVVVALAQLMLVLDATIVNIALPYPAIAATHGYTVAFGVSAGLLGLGFILACLLDAS
jgi:hypothetical protein